MAEQKKVQQELEKDLDSLLKPLGGFGKFQIINILCVCLIILICSFSELSYIFTAGTVKHRCFISECDTSSSGWNDSNKSCLSAYIPTTSSGEFDSCMRYNCTSEKCNGSKDVYECDTFVYETEEWTVGREDWGIHCDSDRYLLTLIGSLNNAGQVVGALYVGYLSDRFGRKVIVTLAIGVAVLGLIKSFAVNYVMMVVLEVIEASMAVALFNGPFVMALEIVDPSKRVLAGTLVNMAYPIGEMILGLAQYLTLDWRTTIRVIYTPFFLTVALYWVVPESVRWLINNQRLDEAFDVLRRIAKTNGKPFPEQAVKEMFTYELSKKQGTNGDKRGNRYIELWRSKKMRLRCITSLFVWLCNTFVFFGLTLNSVSVNDDKFLNFILTGLIEIPAYLTLYFVLDKLGRRVCQSGSLLLCGIACLLDAFVPNDDTWSWAQLVLYLVGKFGSSISFFVIDVYTTEMFPTAMRSTMMSIGLLVGKLASILAPEVPLLADIYKPLPLLIFGIMATASSIVAWSFPETLGSNLPDTIEEAENLGRKKPKSQSKSIPP